MKNRNYKHQTTKNAIPNHISFLEDKQFDDNNKAILKFIEMWKKWFLNKHAPDVKNYMSKLDFVVKTPDVEVITDWEIILKCMAFVVDSVVDTTNSKDHGTAMFPLFNNVWNVGIFGSIWLDIQIDGNGYRLAFSNEEPPIICIHELPSYFLHEA